MKKPKKPKSTIAEKSGAISKLPKEVEALTQLYTEVLFFVAGIHHHGIRNPTKELDKYQELLKSFRQLPDRSFYPPSDWPGTPIEFYRRSYDNSLVAMGSFISRVLSLPNEAESTETDPCKFSKIIKLHLYETFSVGWSSSINNGNSVGYDYEFQTDESGILDDKIICETSRLITHYKYEKKNYLHRQAVVKKSAAKNSTKENVVGHDAIEDGTTQIIWYPLYKHRKKRNTRDIIKLLIETGSYKFAKNDSKKNHTITEGIRRTFCGRLKTDEFKRQNKTVIVKLECLKPKKKKSQLESDSPAENTTMPVVVLRLGAEKKSIILDVPAGYKLSPQPV